MKAACKGYIQNIHMITTPKIWPYKDPAIDFTALAHEPYALLFDGYADTHPQAQYSYICWSPEEIVTVNSGHKGNPFDTMRSALKKYEAPEPHPDLPPFQGGAAGFFGYDLGRYLECVPAIAQDDLGLPDMAIGIYKNVIAYDHHQKKAWILRGKHTGEGRYPDSKQKWIPAHAGMSKLEWSPDCFEAEFIEKIKAVIEYIYAGEIYQANLSRRFEAALPQDFDTFAHYKSLRKINTAPFSAYLNFGDFILSSSSPERFLKCENDKVETRPIKGTLPSSRSKNDLKNSEKDRAENLMIVDLLRNDISKVCALHSVKVPELFKVETFKGLHHLVSTVTGTLREDKNALDLLEACFPGGSITGAPKIRAMEIIEELEPYRRGPYCGAIGMIGFDGFMDTSIAIRTLIFANNKAYLQTGGGIVADSVPEAELQETLDKAQKMFESFENKERAA